MKILHVITNLTSGGAEKLIYDLAPRLRDNGHDVDILVLFEKNNIYIEDLKKLGISVKVLTYNNRFNPYNLLKLINYIKINRYDVVHTHLFPALYFSTLASIFFSKIKFIYTEHSTNNKRRKYKLFRFIEKLIYARFNKIICISKKTEENLRIHINDFSDRIITIQNGVDLERFKNAISIERREIDKSLSEEDKIIIMIGRFSPQKDQLTIIKSMKKLPPEYKLLLIGEGTLQEKCKKEVENLNLKDRVLFLGVRKDVANILKSTDICVVSSIWEGFGLVAVEAMACGTPVIGTNVDGLKEVIGNKDYLFEVGDYNELSNKILKMIDLKSDENYKKFIKNKSNKYSIDDMLKNIITLYKE